MIDTAELITSERIRCNESVHSKKRALEIAATLIAPSLPRMSRIDVFNALNSRERLGSTGLGHGVALPHARVSGSPSAVAACLTLEEPIDFDAPDGERVDILFVLLVPEECNDHHLEILAELARLFGDTVVRDQLRAASEPAEVIELLREHEQPSARGVG
jgi:PTS system nitrogen regulatory IIA component